MSRHDVRSHGLESRSASAQSHVRRVRRSDSSFLHPEDAISAYSPPGRLPLERSDTATTATSSPVNIRKRRDKRRGRSSSRRRRAGNAAATGQWKKLLWVKQSYPDNYTDEETFLDHLQRNPRLRPYEFWPLVADSTIIVQHVCSVIIFVCCFTGIFQDRVSPQTVVSWATIGTVLGWILRDYWQSKEEAEQVEKQKAQHELVAGDDEGPESASSSPASSAPELVTIVPLGSASIPDLPPHSRNQSSGSVGLGTTAASSAAMYGHVIPTDVLAPPMSHPPPWNGKPSPLSPRMQERVTTAKSAILIYCSLLGLSPILKSLTKSTSSDSIWALSSWLMILNVFTFDYGAGPEAKFPASLSTNAALMASTVLASRLPTTTHVFSLTLFSIEVFGLFPVFRRHLRHRSWIGHLWLTIYLVVLASGGLSMVISGGGWVMGVVGIVLGAIITCLSLGLTSWWLIGLQRYKNEIRGPWDPARPVIRRGWD